MKTLPPDDHVEYLKPDFILTRALADETREKQVLTKVQQDNIRYWDYYLHDLDQRIERQAAKKVAALVEF